MRKIPAKLRSEMENDLFYKRCCLSGKSALHTKIDFHHNLIFAGKQINEKWCILPLATDIHRDIVKHKEKCDWVMLNRATDEELRKYSRAIDLIHKRDYLNKKYGAYRY